MSGKARVLYTTELRVPIIDYFAISSFLDAGALHHNMVSTDPDDLTFLYNPYYMMFSYGLGLNVNIPMFPIRLYVAYRFRLNPVTGEIDMFFNHNETFGDSEVPKPEFIFTVAGFF
jgi:outer membrane protein assembly factor BamA